MADSMSVEVAAATSAWRPSGAGAYLGLPRARHGRRDAALWLSSMSPIWSGGRATIGRHGAAGDAYCRQGRSACRDRYVITAAKIVNVLTIKRHGYTDIAADRRLK